MSKDRQGKRTVEIVKPEYQPSKEELEGDMRVDLTFEELTKAVLHEVEVKQVDKPSGEE